MRQKDASLDDIDHEGAKRAIQEWFDGADGQILHVWKEELDNYPTYKVVIATNYAIDFARFFPEINYQAETEEELITDQWNVSIDREANYPQGFTFDELPDANIPDLEETVDAV